MQEITDIRGQILMEYGWVADGYTIRRWRRVWGTTPTGRRSVSERNKRLVEYGGNPRWRFHNTTWICVIGDKIHFSRYHGQIEHPVALNDLERLREVLTEICQETDAPSLSVEQWNEIMTIIDKHATSDESRQ